MNIIERIKRYSIRNSNKPVIIGVRHTLGLFGETTFLDNTIRYLDGFVKKGDKVMLEIPEYPLTDFFKKNVFSRPRWYIENICKYLDKKGCEIIPAEDRERWNSDNSYSEEHTRDEVFIEKIKEMNPLLFIVGSDHLSYLRERLPSHAFVNLVNEKNDKKRYSWLNMDFFKQIS